MTVLDLTAATAEDVIRALLTLEGLATPAEELEPGDRIVYRSRGVTHDTIVADAHALEHQPGWWSITTTAGDSWHCSGRNRGQYRLARDGSRA
jgi:hypothetical protein